MSAAPISAAAQTTPAQAGSGSQGVNAPAGAQKGQKGPPTGFEALLDMLSAAEDNAVEAPAAPKGAGKGGVKTADGATGDKAKDAAGDLAPIGDAAESGDALATEAASAAMALLVAPPQPMVI